MKALNMVTRGKYKKALREAGISTRGMSDSDLQRAYESLQSGEQYAEVAEELPELPEIKKTNPEPTTIENAESIPASNDAAQQLASLIAQLGTAKADESRIIELIKLHSNKPKGIEVKVQHEPKRETTKIERAHKNLDDALAIAQCREHCYLVGPAGTGKTTLAMQVADALQLDFHFTNAVLQKYELMGFVDANGNYQATPFYTWCKNGGVFLFDEIDASQPGALVAFNAALANRVCTFPNGEKIELHSDCICFAAANTYGKGATRQYAGRNPIDAATLDRFAMLELDYDSELELELTIETATAFGGDSWTGKKVFAEFERVRNLASAKQINVIVSVRPMIRAAKLIAQGMDEKRAYQIALYNTFTKDQIAALRA